MMPRWEDSWMRSAFFITIYIGGFILVGFHSSWWIVLGLYLTLWATSFYIGVALDHVYVTYDYYHQSALPHIETLAWNQATEVIEQTVEPSLTALEERIDSLSSRVEYLEDVIHKNHLN